MWRLGRLRMESTIAATVIIVVAVITIAPQVDLDPTIIPASHLCLGLLLAVISRWVHRNHSNLNRGAVRLAVLSLISCPSEPSRRVQTLLC